jgi:hypothetical protein
MKARAEFMPANLASSIMRSASSQFVCATATNGDRKSTGNNFGCTLRCEFSPHSFSQSSSDGTVTSACFEQA